MVIFNFKIFCYNICLLAGGCPYFMRVCEFVVMNARTMQSVLIGSEDSIKDTLLFYTQN